MLKSLSIQGIGEVKRLEDLINTAVSIDFQAVEATPELLLGAVERLGIDATRQLFTASNIRLAATNLPVDWRGEDETYEEQLPAVERVAEISQQLGGHTFFTFFMPSTDELPAPYLLKLTRRVRTIARILSRFDAQLALEYVGPYHLRRAWKYPFIRTCSESLDWFDLIAEPNVGVLLDSFHWHVCQETPEMILDLNLSDVKYVHMSDAPDVGIENVLDNDRLHPGSGTIDLAAFLAATYELGYRGPVTQEVLTPEPPTESRTVLAEKSRAGYEQVFRAAGVS